MADYMCSFDGCGKSFNRPGRLLQHERIHTGERPYHCDVQDCNRSYARSAHLKRHHQTVHSKSTTPEIQSCESCDKTFVSTDNLERHKIRAHAQRENYKCPVAGCGKGFSKRFQLRHHEFEHNGVEPFQCHKENCGRKFTQRSHLLRHLKSHDGYKCDVSNCGETFTKWTEVRKHKAIAHKQDYRCPECTKTFKSASASTMHAIKEHNSDAEVYRCAWDGCSRFYFSKKNLVSHISSYHENITFACQRDGCGKSFSTKQKLTNHGKLHNGIEQPPKVRKKKSLAARLTGFNPKDLPAFDDFVQESDSETAVEPNNKEHNKNETSATEHFENNLGSCSNDLRAL